MHSRGRGARAGGHRDKVCCVLDPQACDAWKKEAEEAGERASAAGAECELAREQRDAMEAQVKKLQEELERLHSGPDPQALPAFSDLETLSLSTLYSLQKQLRAHLEQVDKVSRGIWGAQGGDGQWPRPELGLPGSLLLQGLCAAAGPTQGLSCWRGARTRTPLPGQRGSWRHCGGRALPCTALVRRFSWDSVRASRQSRTPRSPGQSGRKSVLPFPSGAFGSQASPVATSPWVHHYPPQTRSSFLGT